MASISEIADTGKLIVFGKKGGMVYDDKDGGIFKWLAERVQNRMDFERKRGTYHMKMWVPVPAAGVQTKAMTQRAAGAANVQMIQVKRPVTQSPDDMDVDAVRVITADEWHLVQHSRKNKQSSVFAGQGR